MPTIEERIARIRSEFAVVVVDPARGREFVAAQIERLSPGEEEDRAALLAAMPDAHELVATDDDRSDLEFLKVFLLPGWRPLVAFFSAEHQEGSRNLLARFEAALGEEVDTWPPDKPLQLKRSARSGVRKLV